MMKPCSIEWLDRIPAEWEECRIKNVISPREKAVTEDDEVIICFRDGEVTSEESVEKMDLQLHSRKTIITG